MDLQQFARSRGQMVRTYEYDDRRVTAVDLGPGAAGASLDTVDGTAIVVVGDEQYEFELPAGGTAFISNGVLTIEEIE